jgi:hypothetical protein
VAKNFTHAFNQMICNGCRPSSLAFWLGPHSWHALPLPESLKVLVRRVRAVLSCQCWGSVAPLASSAADVQWLYSALLSYSISTLLPLPFIPQNYNRGQDKAVYSLCTNWCILLWGVLRLFGNFAPGYVWLVNCDQKSTSLHSWNRNKF